MPEDSESPDDKAEIYTQRIVAYGDILGWTCACNSSDPEVLRRIKRAIEGIQRYAEGFNPYEKKKMIVAYPPIGNSEYGTIEFSMFSDCFAVSMLPNSGYRIFDILSNICHPLLRLRFSTRGGITIGNLHHVENAVWGPALIEAVNMEKTARYPGLICSPALLQHLQDFEPQGKAVIITDDLGRKIANPFAFGQVSDPCYLDERWSVSDIRRTITNEIAKYSDCGEAKYSDCGKEGIAEKRRRYQGIAEKWRYLEGVMPLMLERFS
jgi:hypothetical protein